jgi:glycosyltransferase involved in cell wall biosynthesis
VIVHVLEGGALYGLERLVLYLLPAMRRRGLNVGALFLAPRGTGAADAGSALLAAGVPTAFANGRPFSSRARSQLDAWRITALHAHGYKATVFGSLLAQLMGVPFLVTYHAMAREAIRNTPGGLQRWRLAFYLWLELQALHRSRGIAAVSDQIREELLSRHIPASRVSVLANGIAAPEAIAPVGRRYRPQLLIVGRLVGGKNVHTAIEALARVRMRHPDAGLVVAGTGPLEAELAEVAVRNGVRDRVTFQGYVADISALMTASDCLVMPSSTEGLPMTILEAMAVRLPIVAAHVGAIPVVVRDGIDALLVPPADTIALTAAVERLTQDEELARALAAEAHARFRSQFSADAAAERYHKWYADMGLPL